MPRTIKDDAGNDIEVFDKSEFETAIAEKAKATEEALERAKQLEQEVNPNWKELRKTKESQDKEIKELRNKLQAAGVKEESPSAFNPEEVRRIASEEAEGTYLNRYKERVLGQFGEKKETVSKYFEKLAMGEKLTEDTIDRLVADAARAVGFQPERNPDLRARFAYQGTAPRFQSEAPDQGFGTTEAGKSMAKVMGIVIEAPKQ